ncbi:M3 family metallopeptidase [Sphingomonas sp. LY54]|uniref:M3 family metallopeptidase n=1 Tax=Sphingomonas sp. LY54 TaxID=3095343 RepID=UPI002D7723E9|nr:M3 family metallopeptidase [Sphingomonas sp. LY54]WRP28433.1 M3 family metallopeptidase [Sphingomonas sp. LY54]
MKAVLLASATALALGGCTTMTSDSAAVETASATPAAQAAVAVPDNILLADWQGGYDGVPPFDKVTPELFPEAIQFGIDEQRREVLAIANNGAAPTFANTVEALEKVGERLDRVLSVFGVMTSNVTTPAYQALDKEWSPKLSAAYDEINLNPKLFERIKAVYEARANSGLDAKQQRLVTRLYDSFVRRGANLDDAQKQQLSAYNQQLAAKFATFSEKVLADESTFITATEAELKGVPADVKAAAASAAKERKLPAGSYAIVNTRSAVDPILTFADNRALRQKVWQAFVNRGDNKDANDTNQIIAEIVKLRADRAKLLGFGSHADWRMQDTMAKTPAAGMALMNRVWPAAVARVKEEVRDQQALATKSGAKITIEPWDYRYYQEKVRKDRYDLSQDEVKPYFALDNIIEASYWAAGELYGLDFKEVTGTVPTWHSDIRVYSVTDRGTGKQVGLFYRDDYARTGKRSGAWATTYRSRAGLLGDDIVLGSNNNNFVKPAPGEPVLISLDDAETLFHEFGHAIHYFLSDVYYPSFGGTPRDFVEYPSQVNENWLLTPQVLSKFAKHYKTGQPMPKALLDKIEASSKFNQGFATVEYLSSALVDMALHMDPNGVVDPDKFERETLTKLGMPKELVMRHRLPQFNHLFSSDAYSAGYYSYLWSETMDADTWAAFEETGNPFDKATADRFRQTLLSTGNETDRAEAYRAFRGRDPDVNALLHKRGFPTN